MYTQYKLLGLVEGKENMSEAAELKGAWMKRSFDAYMLMSVDYIRARILEEDLRRGSVERSEEGAGYGVGGGKSGFKKKWKGKNKDNPKKDGGGGQGEVCFYCKKRGTSLAEVLPTTQGLDPAFIKQPTWWHKEWGSHGS
ncbi:unnamed protein product [Closterium sp. NIES-65]|nr:unnamed protein product [Closterium sp. NIES-65]CAI5957765.1 unnamed protein product [Closterium sp. NIES-65]